jgi:hypothetical protein
MEPTPVYAISKPYGERGLQLEFMPHGYFFPISLPVILHGNREKAKSWTWNGSLEKPTLKPSIRTRHPDGTMSHIWLIDGMCIHLEDSTDGFAGKILPLKDLNS